MSSNPLGGDGPLQLLNVISKNDMSEIRVLDLTVSKLILSYTIDKHIFVHFRLKYRGIRPNKC